MKLLSILILIGILQLSYAQNKLYIGSSIGYAPGKTSMDFRVFDKPIFFMGMKHNFILGGELYYSLEHSPVGISSGIKFNKKWNDTEKGYNYLTIPLVLDVTIGKELFIQAGIGAYSNILLKHKIEDPFDTKTYSLLYGRIISIGVGIFINDNILRLKFENYSDITSAGQYKEYALSGGYDNYFYKFQVNSISLSYLIKIN